MSDPQTPNVDAVVIGAGFGGIYMLHKLRNGLGLKVRAYDKAGGVGGTWYWNKYPGALSDTEAHIYRSARDLISSVLVHGQEQFFLFREAGCLCL